jgi:hypothetical protein
MQLTFRCTAQENVYPAKRFLGLCNRSTALSHDAAIAADGSDPSQPALAVFAVALALADQLAKLGIAIIVFELMWRQACGHVVAMVK